MHSFVREGSAIVKNILILLYGKQTHLDVFKSTTDHVMGQRQVSESQFIPHVMSVLLMV